MPGYSDRREDTLTGDPDTLTGAAKYSDRRLHPLTGAGKYTHPFGPFSGVPSFAKTILDERLQEYLTRSNIEWNCLDELAQHAAEAKWRLVFGHVFTGRPRLRRGAKAEFEYSRETCTNFLIVPFASDVSGTPMHVFQEHISAYECHGALLPLGEFCDAEFFVSPVDFEWTMVHTHEDHAIDGPYFIRREWVR